MSSDLPKEEQDRLAEAIDRYYTASSDLAADYVAVPMDLILLHRIPDVSLFLKGDDGTFKAFRYKGLYISQSELDTLVHNGLQELHIARADVPAFSQYVESLMSEMRIHSPMADPKKVEALRSSAIGVMKDIFETPSPENIQKGIKVVSGFVYLLMKDPKAYDLLLGLSSHDPYTLQHSVGVATNCIILAKKMGINDEAGLIEAGVGGLLHDIGKTRVPREIINKNGPLNEEEWALMKQHAQWGFEMLRNNPNIGTRAKLAVLQHHEDFNGTGYPLGLKGNQVSLFAKLVTISDIYSAITTDRTYSKAKPPFEAFQIMKDRLSHKIDPKLFEMMVVIYGGGANPLATKAA